MLLPAWILTKDLSTEIDLDFLWVQLKIKLFPFSKKITTFDMTFHIVQKHPMTLLYVMQKQPIRKTATTEIQYR